MPDLSLDELLGTDRGSGSLHRLFRERYAEISAMIGKRPSWSARLPGLIAAGYLNDRGGTLTLKTVQATWYRVRQEAQTTRFTPSKHLTQQHPFVPRSDDDEFGPAAIRYRTDLPR